MKAAINAILPHTIDLPQKSLLIQLKHCAKGEKSWCRFQRDLAKGTKRYKGSNRLPEVLFQHLQQIFSRLSADDLFKRCLLGLAQNQNESLNGRLWSFVPKSQF